jgi:acyl-CoA reductase-like NAD-dependent aldehyde dehydrogenase
LISTRCIGARPEGEGEKPVSEESYRKVLDAAGSLLIDGNWVSASTGKTIDVTDPATGERISAAADASEHDVDEAVRAAQRAFERGPWRSMGAEARARTLWRWADLLEKHADELAYLEVRTNGMPLAFARWMIAASTSWLRHFAGAALRILGENASESMSAGADFFHAFSSKEPVGVCGLIIPWNGPTGSFVLKVGPALAAGCTCVIKPAEATPTTALRLGQLAIEAGVPAGVLNIVTGYGATAGTALVQHPLVDKISFTGSTATGKLIGQQASSQLKRITLELGGKSPCIVFDDADMDVAIPGASMAIFANTGQVCFAGSRLFVQRKSYDQVLQGIAKFAAGIKIGSGLDPNNLLGPLISQQQRERVMSYVRSGVADGGEVVYGGDVLGAPGYFMQPTIIANLKASAKIVREEVFGPVLVATPFDEFEEVVDMANDTRYGLGAGIFTRDINKAHNAARLIRAGSIWVNCYGVLHPNLPFGGFGESGLGREMGVHGLDAFLEAKSTFIKLQ